MSIELLTNASTSILAVRKAFGAPGDFGYGTSQGDALSTLYALLPELHTAIATPAPAGATATSDDDGWEWGIVEVFGHRSHAGRTREEERFGAKMLRIDVPNKGDPDAEGWTTHFYGGAAIFSFSLTDKATALRINRPYERPALYRRTEQHETIDDGSSDGDDDVA